MSEPVAATQTAQTTLRAQHSGKCLTVHPGAQYNGAVAYQWTCGQGNNLILEDAGSGYHYIKFVHSGKCLTIDAYAWWDGATINQWDCLGQSNQKWGGIVYGDGSAGIFSEAYPDKCLTVHGESVADGAIINQWSCTPQSHGPNQKWQGLSVIAPPEGQCHPSYQGGTDVARGGCIRIGVGDYDCAGGRGDGPNYVQGPVQVVGSDLFGLDRDNDRIGCESVSDDREGGECHPSYLTVCIPPPPPDLDCGEIPHRNFPVIGSDPHGFDADRDGMGCES